ncbi:Ig-like domain-containing protein [Clostridium oryzae]|uniref:Bacterial Ig-like domain protein n=1 Tax=Clostridium oryzae TaxID=1450648 RepID=A0A1V4IYC6_9CLOT|nr:Ig-like domain-containing protein [Clostridium oryzae]OPJ65072.1 bacterial Ig-like domain protein [Clostridium oryzae]
MKKLLKKKLGSILSVLMLVFIAFQGSGYRVLADDNSIVAVKSVTLSANSLNLTSSGTKCKLKATVKPDNASNKAISWSSSNEDVAQVSGTGEITPLSQGTAVISAKSYDGNHVDYCLVSVDGTKVDKVSGVSMNISQETIAVGSSFTLKAEVDPEYADMTKVSWYSSNENVAKVSSTGKVSAISTGQAVIKAKTVDGNYTSSCIINVIEKITSIKLSKTKLNLNIGSTSLLTAQVKPATVINNAISWKSSKPAVAAVDSNGNVYAISKGTATITAMSAQDNSKISSCTVTVNKVTAKVPVSSIKLNKSSASVKVGKTYKLKPTFSPSSADFKIAVWSSSNNEIATVSPSGVVTGISSGTATIYAKDISGKISAKCKIKVTGKLTSTIQSIDIDKSYAELIDGQNVVLSSTVNPLDAPKASISWTSSDDTVAKVDSNGKVTGISVGTAVIYATTTDGKFSSLCVVRVKENVESVLLNQSTLSLSMGSDPVTLKAVVKPDNVSMQSVTWSSSNPAVAAVNADGKVTPVSKGTTEIIATSMLDSTKSAKCFVTVGEAVKVPVTSLSINCNSLNLNLGYNIKLETTVLPSNATTKAVVWTSSDTKVATVSQDGTITGVSKGAAYIIAKTVDGGYTATCLINVGTSDTQVINVTGVTLNINNTTLNVGGTVTLTPSIIPSNATVKNVTWVSSNDSVAKVDQHGVVTAVSPGTAAIVVKTEDGSFTAYCSITVVK